MEADAAFPCRGVPFCRKRQGANKKPRLKPPGRRPDRIFSLGLPPRAEAVFSYERTVFFEKGGGDLRISFDSGILSRRDDLFRIVRLARPRGRGSVRGADYVFYSSPELSKDGTYFFSINGEKQSELTISESFSSSRFPSGGRPEGGNAPENNKNNNTANTGSDVTKISILKILKRFFSFGV